MKSGWVLSFLVLGLQSTAALAVSLPDGSAAMANIPGANPYEKLANAFAAATPMTMFQLPTPAQSEQWTCAAASKDKPEQLISPVGIPVHVSIKLVVQPATPSTGPLFPGTPEKDQIVDTALFDRPDAEIGNDDLAKSYIDCKVQILETTPDFASSSLNDCSNPQSGRSTVTASFRTKDGMIFGKITQTPSVPKVPAYDYCWKTPASGT